MGAHMLLNVPKPRREGGTEREGGRERGPEHSSVHLNGGYTVQVYSDFVTMGVCVHAMNRERD